MCGASRSTDLRCVRADNCRGRDGRRDLRRYGNACSSRSAIVGLFRRDRSCSFRVGSRDVGTKLVSACNGVCDGFGGDRGNHRGVVLPSLRLRHVPAMGSGYSDRSFIADIWGRACNRMGVAGAPRRHRRGCASRVAALGKWNVDGACGDPCPCERVDPLVSARRIALGSRHSGRLRFSRRWHGRRRPGITVR